MINNQNQDRYLIVYNKYSGRTKLRDRAMIIQKIFKKNNIYHYLVRLKFEQNIEDLKIKKLIKNHQLNKILVIGGDGTLRRVVQYCFFNNIENPIGFFPTGSANLFSFVLDVSYRMPRKIQKILKAKIKKIPIGIVNDKHVFIMVSCYGSLTKIVLKSHRYFKHIFGIFSYLLAIILHSRSLNQKNIKIKIDNQNLKIINANSVIIFLTQTAQTYFPLKFNNIKNFQILIIKNKNIFNLIWGFFQIYFMKRLSKHFQIIAADKIIIDGDFENNINFDGDLIDNKKQKNYIEKSKEEIIFLV